MQSHRDDDADKAISEQFKKEWLGSLQERAAEMVENRLSDITGGKPDEKPLEEWKHGNVAVRRMEDDGHGILRISIGGGESTPVPLDYCVFRGNRDACIRLLERSLDALRDG